MILDNTSNAQYTTDGGAAASDWTTVNATTDGTWFGQQFSLLPDGHAVASGIDYCSSGDAGKTWSCVPHVDSVFDGAVFFYDDKNGWVGSGEINPAVEGWLHRTTDGGQTWSARLFEPPFPVREILFVSPTMGWVAGGNMSIRVGGIYFSMDGGQTWSLDVDSNGHEMDACDSQPLTNAYQVWCAGFSSTDSAVYSLQGASTPVFSPPPGSSPTDLSVTLTSATPNASFYFTMDGSVPTTASTLYTAPILINSTSTVSAIAVAPGFAPSLLATGAYTISPPQLQFNGTPPAITVKAGGSSSAQLSIQATAAAANVTFACSNLPSVATCSFNPASLTATTQPTTVTVTVTSGALSAVHRSSFPPLAYGIAFPGLLLGWLGTRRGKRRPGPFLAMLVALSTWIVLGVSACGGGAGSSTPPPVNPVQATMTVTASAPNAASASIQIPVTINP